MFKSAVVGRSRIEGKLRCHLAWIATVLVTIPTLRLAAAETPSPMALLRGVEAARTEYDSLKVALEVEYILPQPAPTIDCLIEMDGSKRRFEFEVLAGEEADQVTLIDGDEFHGYRRKKGEDVHIYDAQRATGVRGDVAFDPRILGLSDLMSCATTVKLCLWYEDYETMELVGQESLNGVDLWKVRVGRRGSTAEFWIEEPSFRVHRKITETPHMRIVNDSEYDLDEEQSPFPNKVTGKRDYKKAELKDRNEERIYTVKSFDFGAKIPPDRFTLKAMEIPLNTAVVDYRIDRRVGYWNGEELSEHPVSLRERSAVPIPESEWGGRFPFIAINVAAILGLGAIVWIRRKK